MQIHSLKLTVQDAPSKEGPMIATIFGKLILKTGDIARNEDGTPRLDAENQEIPILDDINFVVPVSQSKELKAVIQSLAIEALTLKDMEIAEKKGPQELSHYVDAIKGVAPKPEKKERAPIPVPRRKIKRTK